MAWVRGETRNTLINDVWCGGSGGSERWFTNYIFQAFKTNKINSRRKLLECARESDCWFLPSCFHFFLITSALLINYVNWMRAFPPWKLIENFQSRCFVSSLYFLLAFRFTPTHSEIKSGEKFLNFLGNEWQKFLNLLFKWVEIT